MDGKLLPGLECPPELDCFFFLFFFAEGGGGTVAWTLCPPELVCWVGHCILGRSSALARLLDGTL